MGSFWYKSGFTQHSVGNISPHDVIGFITEHFSEGRRSYVEIQHQVYLGESDKKHYVSLQKGNVNGPYARAGLEYFTS